MPKLYINIFSLWPRKYTKNTHDLSQLHKKSFKVMSKLYMNTLNYVC